MRYIAKKGKTLEMKNQVSNNRIGIDVLVEEILSGEYPTDILPNSALGFSDEQQAQYFSNLRRNLQSDMASAVILNSQSTYELELLKKIKG